MWIFLFYKKLHMTKLSITVKLIPQDKHFYEFWLLAVVRNTTFSVAFCSLYNSVTEKIRTAMSIKHQLMHFRWLKGEIPFTFITCILRNTKLSNNKHSVSPRLADLWSDFLYKLTANNNIKSKKIDFSLVLVYFHCCNYTWNHNFSSYLHG